MIGWSCPKCGAAGRLDASEFPVSCCGVTHSAPAVTSNRPAFRQRAKRLARIAASRKAPSHGPGTELKSLLEELGLSGATGCGCEAKAKQMNQWEIEGCEKNRTEIINWLREARKKTSWSTIFTASSKAASVIPRSHWIDPIPWIVDEAIRRARQRTRCDQMAVVIPYFNPAGYQKLRDNLLQMRDALSCESFVVEAVFPGQKPISNWLALEAGDEHVLWQKERLLNLAAENLPERYTKIAWVDGDILFENPAWHAGAGRLLDDLMAVQLGETVRVYDKWHATNGSVGFTRNAGRWGYAWAARREVFPLYDAELLGGGDMLCVLAWLGRSSSHMTPSPRWAEHYRRWAVDAYGKVQQRLGCVSGRMIHLDHGSREGRQYNSRYHLVRGLDPERDLETDPANGLWRWKTDTYRAAVRGYFERRQDV